MMERIKAAQANKNTVNIVSIICLSIALCAGDVAARIGTYEGGSNYNWYNIVGCNREPYGIIKNYHANGVRATVQNQLGQMYSSGQRRLRIALFHSTNISTGTIVKFSGNNLPAQQQTNLDNFLADMVNAGFVEIIFGFFTQGDNDPRTWSSWNEYQYQRNWNLIVNIRNQLINSGIQYRIDLLNEGTPAPSQTQLKSYARRLWTDYTLTFGKSDTVGFSIIGNSAQNRVSTMPYIYNNNYPYLFDVHFYNNESSEFQAIHNQISSIGQGGKGWIVGEVFYNDAQTATGLNQAIASTSQNVFFLTQWPKTRNSACAHVDVTPPVGFSNYD